LVIRRDGQIWHCSQAAEKEVNVAHVFDIKEIKNAN